MSKEPTKFKPQCISTWIWVFECLSAHHSDVLGHFLLDILLTVCYKTWHINIKGDDVSMTSGQKNHLLQVQAIVTKIRNEPDI